MVAHYACCCLSLDLKSLLGLAGLAEAEVHGSHEEVQGPHAKNWNLDGILHLAVGFLGPQIDFDQRWQRLSGAELT